MGSKGAIGCEMKAPSFRHVKPASLSHTLHESERIKPLYGSVSGGRG
jgi:hypothetical protein